MIDIMCIIVNTGYIHDRVNVKSDLFSCLSVFVLLPNANPAHLIFSSLSLSLPLFQRLCQFSQRCCKSQWCVCGGLLHNRQHASRFHKISSVGKGHANHLRRNVPKAPQTLGRCELLDWKVVVCQSQWNLKFLYFFIFFRHNSGWRT